MTILFMVPLFESSAFMFLSVHVRDLYSNTSKYYLAGLVRTTLVTETRNTAILEGQRNHLLEIVSDR